MTSGIAVTVMTAFVVVLNMITYANLLLPLSEYPDWAGGGGNETLTF